MRCIRIGGQVFSMRRNDAKALQQNVFAVMTNDPHAGLTVDRYIPQREIAGLFQKNGRAEMEGVPDIELLPRQVFHRHARHMKPEALIAQKFPARHFHIQRENGEYENHKRSSGA